MSATSSSSHQLLHWLRSSRARCTAASLLAVVDADSDHAEQDAVELVAAAHAADCREVGIDHADQHGARMYLADHAQAAQSITSAAAVTAWAASIGARP